MPEYIYENQLQTLPRLTPASNQFTSASVGKYTDLGEEAGLEYRACLVTVSSTLGLGTVVFDYSRASELSQTQLRAGFSDLLSLGFLSPLPHTLDCSADNELRPLFLGTESLGGPEKRKLT